MSQLVLAHALTWLVLLPLLGAVGVWGLAAVRFARPRALQRLAMVVTGLQVALAVWVYSVFDLSWSRLDGAGGYQFLDGGFVSGGSREAILGVDGLSMPLVLVLVLVAFVAAAFGGRIVQRHAVYWSTFLAADAALVVALCAVHLGVLVVAWALAFAALLYAVAALGGAAGRRAALRACTIVVPGIALAGGIVIWLATSAADAPAAGGASTFLVTELARVDFLALDARLFGFNAVAVVYGALVISALLLLPLAPLHRWLVDLLAVAPPATAVLLGGVATQVAGYVLVRLGYGALPAGAAWAATTVGMIGVASIVWSGVAVLRAGDLVDVAGAAAVGHGGVVVLAASSLVPAGVEGAVVHSVAHALSITGMLVVVALIRERVGTTRLADLGGIARTAPALSFVAAVAFAASAGVPGTSGFVGELLATAAVGVLHPELALIAAAAAVLGAAAHVRAFRRAFLGDPPTDWEQSRQLEAHGGRFPDVRERQGVALAPIVLAALLLGLHPYAVLRLVGASALDHAARVSPPGPAQIACGREPGRRTC